MTSSYQYALLRRWLVISGEITFALLVAGMLLSYPTTVQTSRAATLIVNPLNPGGDYHTIQAALTDAADWDTILIKNYPATYTESLTINKNIYLVGESRSGTILNGMDVKRPLYINSGKFVSVSNLTIRNGRGDNGAGISNYGTLPLTEVTLSENTAVYNGAAIYNDEELYMENVELSGNTSGIGGGGGGSGGGLRNDGNAILEKVSIYSNLALDDVGGGIVNFSVIGLFDSQVMSNTANSGGGIFNQGGLLTISGSTLRNNDASDRGGAIDNNNGVITITNTTFANNTATNSGAGVENNASGGVSLLNTTFFNNIALSGGAIHNTNTPNTYLKNTLFYNNRFHTCEGEFLISLGHNLEDANYCNLHATGDITNTNAKLGALLYNPPGTTQTMALKAGSPGIDDGDNSGCPVTDQRGVHRPLDGDKDGSFVCDIGAYERMMDIYLPLIFR